MQHAAPHDAVPPAADLRARVRTLAAQEIAPFAAAVDATRYFPLEGYDALRAAGLHAPYLPAGCGGAGFGESAVCAVIEELARVCGSSALIPAANLLGAAPLLLAGDARLKQRYLAPVALGEALITSAMFEDAGDAEEVACRAVRRGGSGSGSGSGWTLFGAKPRAVNAGVAHYYTVLAVTDPRADPEHGLSVFVLEDGDPGFGQGERLAQHGVTGIPARRLSFNGVELGADRLVGAAGDGLRIARRTREYGRVALGAHAVGVAQGALDCAAGRLDTTARREVEEIVADARGAVSEAAAALESADPASAELASRARLRACAAAARVTRVALAAVGDEASPARALADRLQRDARAVAWPAVAELERQGTDLAA